MPKPVHHPECVSSRCHRRILPGQSVVEVRMAPGSRVSGFGHAEHATPEYLAANPPFAFTEDLNWLNPSSRAHHRNA